MPCSFRTIALLLTLAIGACTEPAAPEPRPGISFLAGTTLTDSVDATPPQALVVQVRDSVGATVQGATVRFETRWMGGLGSAAYIAPLQGTAFRTDLAATTDSRGQVSVLVRMGRRAGPAFVYVSVPEIGARDSVQVIVQPGAATQVIVTPLDTGLTVGNSYAPSAGTADRYGNRIAMVPLMLVPLDAQVSVSGGNVRGEQVGRASLTATAGTLRTTLWVTVVPPGWLAATTGVGSGLVTFRLDGSEFRALTFDGAGMKAWSPDGTALAYDLAPTFGYATPVKVVDMNGQTRAISTMLGESVVQLAPAYARTGGWVYFSAIPPGAADVFRLYRVQADGSGTEQLAYEGAEDDFFPSVAPDGTHLVYVRRTGAGMDYLRVLDITRGVVSRIDVPGHSPAWSPTGDEIAYVDVRSDGVIRAMKPDGSGIRQVSATNARYQRGLTWSSDGRWIVARNDGTNRLDLIEAASGRTLPLPFTAGMHFPAWKP